MMSFFLRHACADDNNYDNKEAMAMTRCFIQKNSPAKMCLLKKGFIQKNRNGEMNCYIEFVTPGGVVKRGLTTLLDFSWFQGIPF